MRAVVAHHWRVDPFILRSYPAREFRVMAEARERMVREHNEAIKAAQAGIPPELVAEERRKAREALAASKRRGLKKGAKPTPKTADW